MSKLSEENRVLRGRLEGELQTNRMLSKYRDNAKIWLDDLHNQVARLQADVLGLQRIYATKARQVRQLELKLTNVRHETLQEILEVLEKEGFQWKSKNSRRKKR